MADDNGTPWLKIVLICAAAIVLIAVIVIIYRYQRYLGKTQPMLQADPFSASSGIDINGAKAPLSETGREYTYNMWFNIRDWESGYGQPKCVLHRASKDPTGSARLPVEPVHLVLPDREQDDGPREYDEERQRGLRPERVPRVRHQSPRQGPQRALHHREPGGQGQR